MIWLWSFGASAIWGLFPGDLVIIIVVWGLVEVVAALLVEGWLYEDEEQAESAAPGV